MASHAEPKTGAAGATHAPVPETALPQPQAQRPLQPPAAPAGAGGDEARAFLQRHMAGGGDAAHCRWVETHASWVLLGPQYVYKIKKPVRGARFDFSTSAARAQNAREETRLNRRLAPGVYLGVLALQRKGGQLSLVPEAQQDPSADTLDSVVWMKRLPEDAMLDAVLRRGALDARHIDAVLDVLLPFYRRAAPAPCHAGAHLAHVLAEQAINREVLCRPDLQLAGAQQALDRLDDALARHRAALGLRARRLVEGHGDLRPEHVCLSTPPVVIDALEFDARLRCIDPFDELAFLGLECRLAGAPWVSGQLRSRASAALDGTLPAPLWSIYTALRAALRARLSAAHLLDAQPRTPARWLPQAQRYLDVMSHTLDGLDALDVAVAAQEPPSR